MTSLWAPLLATTRHDDVTNANNKMTLDQLTGSLRSYELEMLTKDTDFNGKEKNIAFTGVSGTVAGKSEGTVKRDCDITNPGTSMEEQVAYITRNFKKFLKNTDRRKEEPERNYPRNQGREDVEETKAKKKGVQCFECEGYGHVASRCTNTLDKKKKSLLVSWSDASEDEESEDECNFSAFVSSVTAGTVREDVSDNDIDNEEFIQNLQDLWDIMEAYQNKLKKEKDELLLELKKKDDFMASKDLKIENLKVQLEKANSDLKKLDWSPNEQATKEEQIGGCKISDNEKKHLITSSFEKGESSKTTGMKNKRTDSFVPVCHYCGKPGHIRPFCYKLPWGWYGYGSGPRSMNRPLARREDVTVKAEAPMTKQKMKQVWVKKEDKCLMMSVKEDDSSHWYFDSGCSRHMTGARMNLKNV